MLENGINVGQFDTWVNKYRNWNNKKITLKRENYTVRIKTKKHKSLKKTKKKAKS